MSKTWDFLSVDKPINLPQTVIITVESTVIGIQYADDDNPIRQGKLFFVIGPTFLGVPIIKRKLTFSEEEAPDLGYKYIEAGLIKLGKKNVHLLLEKN